jgi:hypothetical protein
MNLKTLPYMGKPTNEMDLVEEMNWEDSNKVEKITLDEAWIEELNETDNYFTHSIYAYLDWFYDGEQSEFDRY